ncbi:MAG: nucleotidyltransferase family protein [Bacteroidales bacterium]|nr:nucleotidyltransferase family protein [Bacteroidales bacterium]MBP5723938.1 nucleotidyltransferase family protein [Bacteroidales bacterium]MBQ4216204.1 nucleotidyltransferase family protein [Bacteroidales bacterium]MBR4114993.1 nucleotidyltransferase family protein [Bacteroidales bacterium]
METNTRYLEILQANKSYLQQQFAVDSLVVFGSVARNEMTEDSDVDIFVQMPPKMLLVIGIKQYLESLLNRPVDVVRNHPNMNPLLKKQIEKDGIRIFGAA